MPTEPVVPWLLIESDERTPDSPTQGPWGTEMNPLTLSILPCKGCCVGLWIVCFPGDSVFPIELSLVRFPFGGDPVYFSPTHSVLACFFCLWGVLGVWFYLMTHFLEWRWFSRRWCNWLWIRNCVYLSQKLIGAITQFYRPRHQVIAVEYNWAFDNMSSAKSFLTRWKRWEAAYKK